MADLLAGQAHQPFVGRDAERQALGTMLAAEGPRLMHIHGIAGIGKTALLEAFSREARHAGAVVIRLDCRDVEPTERGFLGALGEAVGALRHDAETLACRIGELGPVVVLAFDTYELFRLLDGWLRQVFLPRLPDNVRVLFFSRQRLAGGWYAIAGWGNSLRAVALAPLSGSEARELLAGLGVGADEVAMIARATQGHPLALKLAAAGCGQALPGQRLPGASIQHALDELTQLFLADAGDLVPRRMLEGVCVTRRVTVSLLRALFPEAPAQESYERLRRLPFADCVADGLVIHDAVRDAIARSLHASDPSRHLGYRRAAWRQLVSEAESASCSDLWRYTADMLYLIEDPVVREAFFPRQASSLTVEVAQPSDGEAMAALIAVHEGAQSRTALLHWWRRLPQGFSVVRDAQGQVVGLYCWLRSDAVEPAWLRDDLLTAQWQAHLRQRPMPEGQVALFCRRWLSREDGDAPGDVQAAVWLDLKRTYMALRPHLQRVYLAVRDLGAYAPVARRLGFEALAMADVELDDSVYYSAMLDFGPGSVDGWLASLAAAELGIQRSPGLLDVEARELLLDDGRVSLTPLEFGVIRHMLAREGRVVTRSELLRDVWGTRYEGGSNVVDAVVHSLRRKLGRQAGRVETVSGVGYRLRAPVR